MTASADIANPQYLTANSIQFGQLIERMMPAHLAEMPEGKLIVAVLKQAWSDGSAYTSARRFFRGETPMLALYCDRTGLDTSQITQIFQRHHKCHTEYEAA